MSQPTFFKTRERKLYPAPTYWNIESMTSPMIQKQYGVVITKAWHLYHKGVVSAFYIYPEWTIACEGMHTWLIHKFNMSVREQIIHTSSNAISDYLKTTPTSSLVELPPEELFFHAEQTHKIWQTYTIATLPLWLLGVDIVTTDLKKELAITEEDFLTLITSTQETHTASLEKALDHALLDVQEGYTNTLYAAEKLSRFFGALPFNYDGPEYWDTNYFKNLLEKDHRSQKEIKEALKIRAEKEQQRIRHSEAVAKKIALTSLQQKKVDFLRACAYWNDDRKRVQSPLQYHYSQILYALSQKFHVPYLSLKYTLTHELRELTIDPAQVQKNAGERINNPSILEANDGHACFLQGEKRGELLDKMHTHLALETQSTNIKGTVASRGPHALYKGVVKIILHPKEGDKLFPGEFLVSTMTSPDFSTLMARAAGFITDEGGITCHAAVIGREMGKPVIIGTGNATKILKDGDLVEVDADTGIVRVL